MASTSAVLCALLLVLTISTSIGAPSIVRFGLGIPDLQKKVSLSDNNTEIDQLVTPDVTPFQNVSLGLHYYKLRIADVTICFLEYTAEAGDAVTIVGAGGYHNRTVDFYSYPDNFTIPSQSSKIRFLHFAAGQGPVTVKVNENTLISTPLSYLAASEYASVPADALRFEVDDAASGNLVTSFELRVDPSSVYTAWIQGLGGKYFGIPTKDFPY